MEGKLLLPWLGLGPGGRLWGREPHGSPHPGGSPSEDRAPWLSGSHAGRGAARPFSRSLPVAGPPPIGHLCPQASPLLPRLLPPKTMTDTHQLPPWASIIFQFSERLPPARCVTEEDGRCVGAASSVHPAPSWSRGSHEGRSVADSLVPEGSLEGVRRMSLGIVEWTQVKSWLCLSGVAPGRPHLLASVLSSVKWGSQSKEVGIASGMVC